MNPLDSSGVVVIDETLEVRSVVKTLLNSTPRLTFAGAAPSLGEGIKLIGDVKPALVLMDFTPGQENEGAPDLIRQVSPDSRVIAWTDREDPESITAIIAAGASGYLLKSAGPEELLEHLHWAARGESVISRRLTSSVLESLGHLYRSSQRRAEDLHISYLSTVDSLATALETKDDVTGNHALRVRDYATILSEAVEPELLEADSIVFGFLLHDVGKIGIPDKILTKPGPLDEDEWKIMREHPQIGARILDSVSFLRPHAVDIVLAHHEKWDGTGYPNGLKGKAIPLGARVFSVVDAFDAMTTDRPYRRALPVGEAIDEISSGSETQFDPEVVERFLDVRSLILGRMAEDLKPDATRNGSSEVLAADKSASGSSSL